LLLRAFGVLLLLLFCPCTSATDEDFLVVHKRASISKLKSVEHVTVSISLHNVGFSTAYDVSLNDDTWPSEKFNLVNGNASNSWDKLEAGKSVVHVFVLELREKGLFYGAPAVVRYKITRKSALQEAFSTSIPRIGLNCREVLRTEVSMAKGFCR
ncbi:hypothetical protein GOP47_0018323, partial [Adiantum capillus-veneris]